MRSERLQNILRKLPIIASVSGAVFLVVASGLVWANASSCGTALPFSTYKYYGSRQSECFAVKNGWSNGIELEDITLCEKADNKALCYTRIAEYTLDSSVCDRIPPTKGDGASQGGCLRGVVEKINNPDLCGKILLSNDKNTFTKQGKADSCYYSVAQSLDDGYICANIKDQDIREQCGLRLHVCELSKKSVDGGYKKICPQEFNVAPVKLEQGISEGVFAPKVVSELCDRQASQPIPMPGSFQNGLTTIFRGPAQFVTKDCESGTVWIAVENQSVRNPATFYFDSQGALLGICNRFHTSWCATKFEYVSCTSQNLCQ